MNPQITGNIGLYFVCYELSRRGWNVMPTARNARGVDIIAYNDSADSYIGVQVKALKSTSAVPLGNSLDKVMGDFWIIANKLETTPSIHILLPGEVIRGASKNEKDGKSSFWLESKYYTQSCFVDRWDIIQKRQEHIVQALPINIDQDFSVTITPGFINIFVAEVKWPEVHTPVKSLSRIASLQLDSPDLSSEIDAIILKTKSSSRYFGTCLQCGETMVQGHMHSETQCQSCAQTEGVVY